MRSKRITADTQIATNKVTIYGYQIFPDGSNAATLELYNEADNSATAGAKVTAARVAATESREVMFMKPLYMETGCYADITGDNAEAFIFTS